jgi:DNA-directed RNA polymerase subunit RPC12/RpoP
VHEKLKRFRCSYCSKEFSSKPGMESHINGIHLKLKFYECHICRKNFRFQSNLSRHLKTQHDKVCKKVSLPSRDDL